ncbi:hypothetical protein [Veronia pacifica]|uniref:Uncharacterized protein n=1 Tax=Veronia pacifica TaxID=1080227 RepID=A0A1C3ERN1_9GAMM|nr:hypothetical protein [Veronia pacifica]ODA35890.1 hypothetical protein A8L45_02320 [Veronia pacifica]
MNKLKVLAAAVCLSGLSMSAFASQDVVVSKGFSYKVKSSGSAEPNNNIQSRQQPGFFAGQLVINEPLALEGKLTGSVIIKTADHDTLSFSDPDASIMRVGGGFWLLKYPPNVELLSKKAWLEEQAEVLNAEIEVQANLNIPN